METKTSFQLPIVLPHKTEIALSSVTLAMRHMNKDKPQQQAIIKGDKLGNERCILYSHILISHLP